MESETSEEAIKETKQQLESRADILHTAQLDLIACLQSSSLVPDIVSSLDISLKAISAFNSKPFTPLSQILPSQPILPKPFTISKIPSENNPKLPSSTPPSCPSPRALIEESGGPLSVVRSMAAVCLLERVPFNPIDSSTVLRKLENDSSVTVVERAALRELGGESGAILAVEMVLRSMAEDNGGGKGRSSAPMDHPRSRVFEVMRDRVLSTIVRLWS